MKQMNANRFALLTGSLVLLAAGSAAAQGTRSAYSYVRETSGQVIVQSPSNGEVEARRNLPITAGDEMKTEDPARAEVALADGNILHVGGGTKIKFASLYAQQGSDDEVSAVDLSDGSVILSVVGSDERSIPRIDTADATVYATSGSRVRVNSDVRRGTAVVVRAGSVEVRTRSGSYTVRAGNYMLVQGDQEPEIARGSFSRDRFDLWAADRLETTYDAPQSASGRYVDEEYAGDVQSLDGYGDWDYSSTYSSYVWRPRVAIGWQPYSYGSWYSTPIGLSWWSLDPWGWYPYHYGNWFFDVGWNSWCWTPGYVYSPAWVYWGYTPGYFGWCPTGWYGGYSPWWDTYYRDIGWGRNSLAFAINGRFSTRQVDVRGWNFTGVSNLGTRGRLEVVPGTRVVDRLGGNIAISSRPIVLSSRGGNARDALRDHVREAPGVIERTTSSRDTERLTPVVGRQKTLPPGTVEALIQRTVTADRGRLTGPGVSEMTPHGGTAVVERNRTMLQPDSRRSDAAPRTAPGRTVDRSRTDQDAWDRSRTTQPNERSTRPDSGRTVARPESPDSWRGRPNGSPTRSTEAPRAQSQRPTGEDWRQSASPRGSTVDRGQSPEAGSQQGWRSRPDLPPARRVIEGSVPGRRSPETGYNDGSRQRGRDGSAAPRDMGPRPDAYSPRDSAPRGYAREAPAPRGDAPRSIERSSPAPRSAPPPQAAPRSAPAPSAPGRSAPPPSSSGSRGRP